MRVIILLVAVAICAADTETLPETTFDEPPETPEYTPETTEAIGPILLDAADALCSAGYYSPTGFATCLQCEKGTYSPVSQQITSCPRCSPGKYTAVDGSIQCSLCPAGTFSYLDGSSTCTSCPPWTGSFAGSSVCVTCSNSTAGELCLYADQTSCPLCASACVLCNAGYYNDGLSSEGCVACGAGKYSSIRGAWDSGQCYECARGTYAKRSSSGLTACLSCGALTGWPAPGNADYIELRSNSSSDTFMCRWSCNDGFSQMSTEPLKTSTAWVNSYNSLVNSPNLFEGQEASEMITLKYSFCCGILGVGTGKYLAGCSKSNTGNVTDCAPVPDARFIDVSIPQLNKCAFWECNDGYYRLGSQCIAQPVCDTGSTYRRGFDGSLVLDSLGSYICIPCPVCTNGAEAITACNSTHSSVCKRCGGSRPFSVNGESCIANVPYGFRPVSLNMDLSQIPWGQRPVLDSLNAPLAATGSRLFFYYIQCQDAGYGRSFTGGDTTCSLPSSSCTLCNIQCKPWTGSSWFTGEGFYGSDPAVSCFQCTFEKDKCSTSGTSVQFLNMSTCGPTQPPQCNDCPARLIPNQAGWATPTDPSFNGKYPCRVLCDTGYSEVNDACENCPDLPLNVKLITGCEWECQTGYIRSPDRTQCVACPPADTCAVGFYSGYSADLNACKTCLACDPEPNAVFTSNGMLDQEPTSCAFSCNSGFYNNFGSCSQCRARTCTNGQYFKQCTPTSDTECVTCKQCPPGQRVEKSCGSGNDTVCTACDPALLPANASWTAAGCVSWACNLRYWLDGSVCSRCSVSGDCALGFQLVDIQQCLASSSAARGKCDECPTPPAGQCFSGAANCGLKLCNAITAAVTSLVGVTSASVKSSSTNRAATSIVVNPITSATVDVKPSSTNRAVTSIVVNPITSATVGVKPSSTNRAATSIVVNPITSATVGVKPSSTNRAATSIVVNPSSTNGAVTSSTMAVTNATSQPSTTPVPEPIAFATVASLTIDSSVTVTSVLLDQLVQNVSQIVCSPGVGVCNVSVISVTVDDVVTFCTDGVCPGFAKRRRLLLLNTGVVDLGIITEAKVPDFTGALGAIESVVDTRVQPNAPIATVEQLAQLRDSRVLAALVANKFTEFNVIGAVSNVLGLLVLVIQVAIGIVVVSVILCCCFCCKGSNVLVKNPHNIGSQFTALDSIRISKESLKPYIKTA